MPVRSDHNDIAFHCHGAAEVIALVNASSAVGRGEFSRFS